MIETKTDKDKEKLAEICPYCDDDCVDMPDHFDCWVGDNTDHPFPGTCPFVFGPQNNNNRG